MKTIGIIGGISWESSREYYRLLNEAARAAKGGLHSAPIILHSFDFAPIAEKQTSGAWDALDAQFVSAAKGLEQAGADAILIGSNYMHRCASAIEAAIQVPMIHIADAIGARIKQAGQQTVGLLGAQGTMEHPFYKERLAAQGIEVVIPGVADRIEISRIIFDELCQGRFTDSARETYLEIMQKLIDVGAEGIILGCTEIEQLIRPQDTQIPIYPSAEIHAAAAAEFMLGEERAEQAA